MPETAYAVGQAYRADHGEFDNITMLFTYAAGHAGMYGHSGFLGGRRNPFIIRGTQGLIACDYHRITIEPKTGGTNRDIVFAPDAGAFFGGLHQAMWTWLAAGLRTRETPPYTADMAFWDVATLAAVEASLRTKAPVRVADVAGPQAPPLPATFTHRTRIITP